MKLIIKTILLVICAALLIWDASQMNVVKLETKEVLIEYQKYEANNKKGINVEATIIGLIHIGTERTGNGALSQGDITGNYYLAVIEDHTFGVVIFDAKENINEKYGNWLIQSQNDYEAALKRTTGFKIRGTTKQMPKFERVQPTDINIYDPFGDEDEKDLFNINANLSDITLLDTRGDYPDKEIIKPEEVATLGKYKIGVVIATVLFAALLIKDIFKHFSEKRETDALFD